MGTLRPKTGVDRKARTPVRFVNHLSKYEHEQFSENEVGRLEAAGYISIFLMWLNLI